MIVEGNRGGDLYPLAIGLSNIQHSSREGIGEPVLIVVDAHIIDDLHVFVVIHKKGDVKIAGAVEILGFKANLIGVGGLGFEGAGQVAVPLRDRLVSGHRARAVLDPEATKATRLKALGVARKNHRVLGGCVSDQSAEGGVVPFFGIGDIAVCCEAVNKVGAEIAIRLEHPGTEVLLILGVSQTQLDVNSLGKVKPDIRIRRPPGVFAFDFARLCEHAVCAGIKVVAVVIATSAVKLVPVLFGNVVQVVLAHQVF